MRSPILAPVITLILWTFVMWAWLYATRIPAIIKGGIVYDPMKPVADFNAQIPPQVRWKADNYNHLMEQPTLFYAVALGLTFRGAEGGINTVLAWTYVGLRIVHSLVQVTVNKVMLRFAIFMAASVVLLAMTIRAAFIMF